MSKTTVIFCPECDTAHEASEKILGEKVRCSNCKEKFILDNIPKELHNDDSFVLLDKIGQGGMGAVFRAEQTTLNRNVALKVLDEKLIEGKEDKDAFFQEAIITANLNHPNIVPIHELGIMNDGAVYYTMKEIIGESWENSILKNSLDDNLDILLKICDAVAFAHDKGFIHRDIKPENVMIGQYGEILLVDWGLAVSIDKKRYPNIIHVNDLVNTSGSPAFMAPEMALCQKNKIGIGSDIYLLGAILFFFNAKVPPHPNDDPYKALEEAKQNIIFETEIDNEFIEIAKKAMSTNIEERYYSVKDFQNKIKMALTHIESIKLAESAKNNLENAINSEEYQEFNQVVFGCNEAIKIFPENLEAQKTLEKAILEYGNSALKKQDFDLVLSITKEDEKYIDINNKAKKEIKLRESRVKKLKLMKLFLFLFLFIVIAVLAISVIKISKSEKDALLAKEDAIESKIQADKSAKLAKKATKEALMEKQIANIAKENALKAKIVSEKALLDMTEAKKQQEIEKENAKLAAQKAEDALDEMYKAQNLANIAQEDLTATLEKNVELAKFNEKAEKLNYERKVSLLNNIVNNIMKKQYKEALKLLRFSPEQYRWKELYQILVDVINCKKDIYKNAKNDIGKQQNINKRIASIKKVDENYVYLNYKVGKSIITEKYTPLSENADFLKQYYPEIHPIALNIYLGKIFKKNKTENRLKFYLKMNLGELKEIK